MIVDSKESKTTNCVCTCQRFFLFPYLKLENVAERTIVLASRRIVRKTRCIHYSYVFPPGIYAGSGFRVVRIPCNVILVWKVFQLNQKIFKGIVLAIPFAFFAAAKLFDASSFLDTFE